MNRKTLASLIITVAIVLILAITNPGVNTHREAVKRKVSAALEQTVSESMQGQGDEMNESIAAIGQMLTSTLVDGLVNSAVSSNNYILFSTTRVSWEGDSRVVGFGILGNVFISDKLTEQMEKQLEEFEKRHQ